MEQFYLKTTKERGFAKLYTNFRRGSLRFVICTGILVNIENWNKSLKSQSAKTKYLSTEEGHTVQELMTTVSEKLDTMWKDGSIRYKEDKDAIDEAISKIVNLNAAKADEEIKVRDEKKKRRIIDFCEKYTEGVLSGTIRNRHGKPYSKNQGLKWKVFCNQVKEFCNPEDTFDDIDKAFSDKFRCKLELHGYMESTLNDSIALFCRLCRVAASEGVNKNVLSLRVWQHRQATVEEKRTSIYLNDDELNALYDMELTGSEEIARDTFILGCLTCQRFSDYTDIKPENIKKTMAGNTVVGVRQKKTGTYVEIPFYDDRIGKILAKYNNSVPHIYNATFSKAIKNICRRLAETVPSLNQEYVSNLTMQEKEKEESFIRDGEILAKGGKLSRSRDYEYKLKKRYAEQYGGSPLYKRNENGEVIRFKWELVSSHTARRSGITNLYKGGILDNRDIMSLSGHKTETVFNTYVKATASEKADGIFAKLRAARG